MPDNIPSHSLPGRERVGRLGYATGIAPMLPVEYPVRLEDGHATIYKALGIPADTSYVVEARPFYVTKDGKGQPIEALLA